MEVCVDCVESAVNAERGGWYTIEYTEHCCETLFCSIKTTMTCLMKRSSLLESKRGGKVALNQTQFKCCFRQILFVLCSVFKMVMQCYFISQRSRSVKVEIGAI